MLQKLVLSLLSRTDDRRSYKEKFDPDSLARKPVEFWHGVNAKREKRSREDCPYRLEKADNWRKGYDSQI